MYLSKCHQFNPFLNFSQKNLMSSPSCSSFSSHSEDQKIFAEKKYNQFFKYVMEDNQNDKWNEVFNEEINEITLFYRNLDGMPTTLIQGASAVGASAYGGFIGTSFLQILSGPIGWVAAAATVGLTIAGGVLLVEGEEEELAHHYVILDCNYWYISFEWDNSGKITFKAGKKWSFVNQKDSKIMKKSNSISLNVKIVKEYIRKVIIEKFLEKNGADYQTLMNNCKDFADICYVNCIR